MNSVSFGYLNEYSKFENMSLLRSYETNDREIKFVIQGNRLGEFRFRFDPMEIVKPYHTQIAKLFDNSEWKSINGGRFKIIDNKVILFWCSLDLGDYDDDTAIEAAKKIFPYKEICSYSGLDWELVEELYF